MNPCIDYCFLRFGKEYTNECDDCCEYAKSVAESKRLREENEKLKERVLDARLEGYTQGLSEMSDDLEHLKSVLRENGIFIIPPKYPWEKSGWNMP